jgi:hydroxymethylpyrimidine pyrophosphatase-like HAD family hydrolase
MMGQRKRRRTSNEPDQPAQRFENMGIRLLSTDFDGTLFAEFENPPIPVRLQQLIAMLQAGGAKWAINTGRDMSSLMEILARTGIEIEPDYLVLVEREIYVHDESQYVPLEPWNSECHASHRELFHRMRPDLPRLVSWIEERFHARLYEDAYSPLCIIAGHNNDMDVIHKFLDDYCAGQPDLTLVRNDVYARFSHTGYSKGTALGELSRRLRLGPEEVFAAGDHLNDLSMLTRRYAHHLAAPANAVPEVRQQLEREGGRVSGLPHGYGIAELLEAYVAQAGGGRL